MNAAKAAYRALVMLEWANENNHPMAMVLAARATLLARPTTGGTMNNERSSNGLRPKQQQTPKTEQAILPNGIRITLPVGSTGDKQRDGLVGWTKRKVGAA